MSQSLVKNYLHIVYSTKHRKPLIIPEVEARLYDYVGGICRKLESPSLKIGGHLDHIHVLCRLSQKIALMKFVEEIKSHSSKWIKAIGCDFNDFYWQDGYGAFSVDPKEVDRVIAYIANQHLHHANQSFEDEFRFMLKEHDMPYDERYVWG
jgi:REP element-mobilizing transposase RayT